MQPALFNCFLLGFLVHAVADLVAFDDSALAVLESGAAVGFGLAGFAFFELEDDFLVGAVLLRGLIVVGPGLLEHQVEGVGFLGSFLWFWSPFHLISNFEHEGLILLEHGFDSEEEFLGQLVVAVVVIVVVVKQVVAVVVVIVVE